MESPPARLVKKCAVVVPRLGSVKTLICGLVPQLLFVCNHNADASIPHLGADPLRTHPRGLRTYGARGSNTAVTAGEESLAAGHTFTRRAEAGTNLSRPRIGRLAKRPATDTGIGQRIHVVHQGA